MEVGRVDAGRHQCVSKAGGRRASLDPAARTLADRVAVQTLEELWPHRYLALGFALASVVRTLREIDRGGHSTLAPVVWLLARSLAQSAQSRRRGSRFGFGPLRGPLWDSPAASGASQRTRHDAI